MRYIRDSARPRKRFVGLRLTDTYSGYLPVTKRCRLMLDDFAISVRCARDNPRRDGDDDDDDGDGDDVVVVVVDVAVAVDGTRRRRPRCGPTTSGVDPDDDNDDGR